MNREFCALAWLWFKEQELLQLWEALDSACDLTDLLMGRDPHAEITGLRSGN
jgi:hypothetical protein